MKTEQTVVSESSPDGFAGACRTLLNQGWRVIPGTVAVSTNVSAVTVGHTESLRSEKYVANGFVAFFER